MKTEIKTPITDTSARKLETVSLNQAEGHLVKHLLELYNAVWESGRCKAHCECAVCEASEKAGNHNVLVFESLTQKASVAITQRPV